jgi:small subunit ribosomal protein S5
MSDVKEFIESENLQNFIEKIVKISRVAKVVKGGRRFSFSALVAVGDGNGKAGLGYGKANEVSDAISKATQQAVKYMDKIKLTKHKTLPHEIIGKYKSSKVVMRPAAPGTGVIAGGAVRAIMEVVGVKDCLTKILGSKNQLNVAKAALNGLMSLRDIKEVASRRGKKMIDLF